MGFTIDVGAAAPGFHLRGVDGGMHGLNEYADKKAVMVVFTCNHCPAAVACAVRIPHVFLLDTDRKVVHHGRIDDNVNDPSAVTKQDHRQAIDEVLAGKPVSEPVTTPVGCTVKWWGKDPHWMPEE